MSGTLEEQREQAGAPVTGWQPSAAALEVQAPGPAKVGVKQEIVDDDVAGGVGAFAEVEPAAAVAQANRSWRDTLLRVACVILPITLGLSLGVLFLLFFRMVKTFSYSSGYSFYFRVFLTFLLFMLESAVTAIACTRLWSLASRGELSPTRPLGSCMIVCLAVVAQASFLTIIFVACDTTSETVTSGGWQFLALSKTAAFIVSLFIVIVLTLTPDEDDDDEGDV